MARTKVKQAGHGFSVLQVVRFVSRLTGLVYEPAIATERSSIRGVVSEVQGDNRFVVTFDGLVRSRGHLLTFGNTYYISPSTAGGVVSAAPRTGQVDPIFIVTSEDNVLVFPTLGGATAYRKEFTEADLIPATRVLRIRHNLGHRYMHVTVYDSNGDLFDTLSLSATAITAVDSDTVEIDFTGQPGLVGSWHAVVSV